MGEKAATKKVIPKTANRQGFKIDFPVNTPTRLRATKKTGSSNAKPKMSINRRTKRLVSGKVYNRKETKN